MSILTQFETKHENGLFLLSPSDRVLAFEKIGQLAMLSTLGADRADWILPGFAHMALSCADAYLAEDRRKPWQREDFEYYSLSGGAERADVLVVAISETSDGFPGMCAVADSLGAGGFQPLEKNQLAEFLELLDQARKIVFTMPEYREIVLKNTGFIVPFRCEPPGVGSGSALQIPGALLLPSNVPAVVLAECWIHEALHTELHLAEWLEGAPPASANEYLPTPWRTVTRPASMLLHGAYVFSSLLKFMNSMRVAYNQVPSHWHLSATSGKQVLIKNVEANIDFRKDQIIEAMHYLEGTASLTSYGKITEATIRQQLLSFAWT